PNIHPLPQTGLGGDGAIRRGKAEHPMSGLGSTPVRRRWEPSVFHAKASKAASAFDAYTAPGPPPISIETPRISTSSSRLAPCFLALETWKTIQSSHPWWAAMATATSSFNFAGKSPSFDDSFMRLRNAPKTWGAALDSVR